MAAGMSNVGNKGQISIILESQLASGAFSTIFKGRYDEREIAVKRIQIDENRVKRETLIMRELQHKNIVDYRFYDTDEDYEYIVMEYCFMSLDKYLSEGCDFNKKRLLQDMVLGLQYLHEKDVIHRNIHTSNVLLVGSIGNVTAKLADFGIARLSPDGSSVSCTGQTRSLRFCNPEELRKEKVGKRSDIYALSLCFYTTLSGQKSPFGTDDDLEIQSAILDGKEPDVSATRVGQDPSMFERYAADLINSMLRSVKSQRPYITGVKVHYVFWDMSDIVSFLQEVSDQLNDRRNDNKEYETRLEHDLEMYADWKRLLVEHTTVPQRDAFNKMFKQYYRNNSDRVTGLLRVIRNCSHHFGALNNEIKIAFGGSKNSMMEHLVKKFPRLLPVVFQAFKLHPHFARFYRHTGSDGYSPIRN